MMYTEYSIAGREDKGNTANHDESLFYHAGISARTKNNAVPSIC